jgi:hypothetical protein
MTIRKLFLLLLIPAAALPAATDDNIEFSGVLVVPDKTTVHLASRSSGTSAWIALGQSFEGYTVSAYEAKTDTVVLTKEGVTLRVRLNTAKVKEGKPPLDPLVVAQLTKAVLNNLRQLGAAADQYYLEHGTNHATLADLIGPANYIRELKSVDNEDYSQLEFTQGKDFSITTASGVTVTYKQ